MRNKNLSEIRPARTGVKLKNKKRPPRRPPEQAKVVRNAVPPRQQNELPPPTEEAARAVIEAQKAREELMEAVRHINREVMSSRVLPENRSVSQTAAEKEAIHRLWNAAVDLDRVSPGEGLLGVSILAVRQGLLLRDAGNKQAYEMVGLKRELDEVRSTMKQQGQELALVKMELDSLRISLIGDGYGEG